MAGVGNIYFDRVSQIRLDRWTKGRTALVGDAVACVSFLAGQGSILAMARLMCWRASCAIAGAITTRLSRATSSGQCRF
jgi:flavin-dependent dehydrogenase